jgi:CubicO group peptidase (beta-lactamase class C family)
MIAARDRLPLARSSCDSPSMSIDSLCKRWLKGHDGGLAVLVIQGGKVVHKQGYGFANVEDERAPDAGTIFDLASCSKHFTATAIMMLAEREKLSYDDPLTKFFPFPEYAQAITVRHLLHHTGGLKDYFELYEEDGDDTSRWGEGERPTSADVVAALAKEPEPDFAAGERFSYSNSGYVVLAEIVSKVSGKPFPRFLREEIFKPLGMSRSRVNDGTRERDANQARGYEDDEPCGATALDDVYGDGAVQTTLDDLVRWNAAMDAHKLVSKKTQQEAWKSGTLAGGKKTDYGFGWFVGGSEGDRWVNHEGSYGGFRTYYAKEIDSELTVLVLSNFDQAEPETLADAISESLGGDEEEEEDDEDESDEDDDEEDEEEEEDDE